MLSSLVGRPKRLKMDQNTNTNFFFLVLCKICLQKKLQTKIISVKKMSSNYKGENLKNDSRLCENLKIDSRLFGQIQVQEIISARTFM